MATGGGVSARKFLPETKHQNLDLTKEEEVKLKRYRVRGLTRIIMTVATLALTLALATAAQAHPGRTTKAPPPLPATVRNAEQSALQGKLAQLHLKRHTRLSARELKALGITPVPKRLAARLTKVVHSTRASAAVVGDTYWGTYQVYGNVWEDVYYTSEPDLIGGIGPDGGAIYEGLQIFMNYKICDWQGNNCAAANQASDILAFGTNIGNWYFEGATDEQLGLGGPGPGGFPPYGFFNGGSGIVVN